MSALVNYKQFNDVDMNTLSPVEQDDFVRQLLLYGVRSKIVAIYAENFLSIEEGRMDFDLNHNVHALVGYNDSGKTGFTRIFDIIFYDMHTNLQSDMIHDANGATYFKVGITFEDGVSIEKVKRITGESIWTMRHKDYIIYTNAKDTQIISVDGVPQMIKSYLGVKEANKERLNIRRNSDKLFLVHMSAGDNSKVIYTLLELDNVTDVQTDLNKERNALATKISSMNFTRRSHLYSIERMKVMSTPEENRLKVLTEMCQNQLDRTNLIRSVYNFRKKLMEIEPTPELNPIDLTKYRELQQLVTLREAIKYKPQKQLNLVSLDRLNLLSTLVNTRKLLDEGVPPKIDDKLLATENLERIALLKSIVEARERLKEVQVVPQVETLVTDKLTFLQQVLTYKETMERAKESYENTLQQKEQLEEESKQLVAKYNLKVCTRCGELTTMQEVV